MKQPQSERGPIQLDPDCDYTAEELLDLISRPKSRKIETLNRAAERRKRDLAERFVERWYLPFSIAVIVFVVLAVMAVW